MGNNPNNRRVIVMFYSSPQTINRTSFLKERPENFAPIDIKLAVGWHMFMNYLCTDACSKQHFCTLSMYILFDKL